jgi:hypothetical protein
MAKESGRNQSTDELRAEIARSRERVGRDLRGLRYELDFSRKFRRSFRQQTVAWLTAVVVVGTLIAVLPVRKKKVYIDAKSGRKTQGKLLEAGFALGLLKIAASLFRPAITTFITNKIRGNLAREHSAKKLTRF